MPARLPPCTARNRYSGPQLRSCGSEDGAAARLHHRSSHHHSYTSHQRHDSGSGSGSDEDGSSSSSRLMPPRCYADYASLRPLPPSPPRQISSIRTNFAPDSPRAHAPFNHRSMPLHHADASNAAVMPCLRAACARSSTVLSSDSTRPEARGQCRGVCLPEVGEREDFICDDRAALVHAASATAATAAAGATRLEGVFQAKLQSLPLQWKLWKK